MSDLAANMYRVDHCRDVLLQLSYKSRTTHWHLILVMGEMWPTSSDPMFNQASPGVHYLRDDSTLASVPGAPVPPVALDFARYHAQLMHTDEHRKVVIVYNLSDDPNAFEQCEGEGIGDAFKQALLVLTSLASRTSMTCSLDAVLWLHGASYIPHINLSKDRYGDMVVALAMRTRSEPGMPQGSNVAPFLIAGLPPEALSSEHAAIIYDAQDNAQASLSHSACTRVPVDFVGYSQQLTYGLSLEGTRLLARLMYDALAVSVSSAAVDIHLFASISSLGFLATSYQCNVIVYCSDMKRVDRLEASYSHGTSTITKSFTGTPFTGTPFTGTQFMLTCLNPSTTYTVSVTLISYAIGRMGKLTGAPFTTGNSITLVANSDAWTQLMDDTYAVRTLDADNHVLVNDSNKTNRNWKRSPAGAVNDASAFCIVKGPISYTCEHLFPSNPSIKSFTALATVRLSVHGKCDILNVSNSSEPFAMLSTDIEGTDMVFCLKVGSEPCKAHRNLEANRWYVLCATISNSGTRMYVDGELINAYPSVKFTNHTNCTIVLKSGISIDGYEWKDIQIYEMELSAGQVQAESHASSLLIS
jgi:hypothetical protein